MKKYHPSVKGFTLIELMVTIAVMVVLGMMAAPALQNYVARAGVQTLQNDFMAAINRARAEALSRNTCVSVCQLNAGTTGNSCQTGTSLAGQWHRGWIVYENRECAALSATGANPPTGAEVLQVRQAGNPRYLLTTDPGSSTCDSSSSQSRRLFTFNSQGDLMGQNETLCLYDSQNQLGPYGRALSISAQGRVLAQSIDPNATATAAGNSGTGGSTGGSTSSGSGQ